MGEGPRRGSPARGWPERARTSAGRLSRTHVAPGRPAVFTSRRLHVAQRPRLLLADRAAAASLLPRGRARRVSAPVRKDPLLPALAGPGAPRTAASRPSCARSPVPLWPDARAEAQPDIPATGRYRGVTGASWREGRELRGGNPALPPSAPGDPRGAARTADRAGLGRERGARRRRCQPRRMRAGGPGPAYILGWRRRQLSRTVAGLAVRRCWA